MCSLCIGHGASSGIGSVTIIASLRLGPPEYTTCVGGDAGCRSIHRPNLIVVIEKNTQQMQTKYKTCLNC